MSLPSLALLFLPQRNSVIAPDSLARLGASVGAAVVLPPAGHLRELTRDQLGAVGTDFVLLLEAVETPDAASIREHLEALQRTSASFAGQVFRVASLRAALRAPLIDGETIYDEIAGDWLRFNLAAHALALDLPAPPFPFAPPRTARQALVFLALVHHLLCRCPVLPETLPLRRTATQLALLAWRCHRRELPAGTANALATIFHLAPSLPVIERMKIGIECIATRFAPASRGTELIAWCAEIEVVFPGFFSRPALWPPVLQPPP